MTRRSPSSPLAPRAPLRAPRFTLRASRLALPLLIAAALACSLLTPAPTPTPSPTPSPTPTPAASPTPLPPLTPRVIDALPLPGDELPLDGAVTVYFDQPMQRSSVENAFRFAPTGAESTVAGSFSWPDDATVQFKPAAPLDRAANYKVSIAEGARSQAGLALLTSFHLQAQTVGYLQVTQVIPDPQTGEVDTRAAITVMFNRPVVPLTLLADQTGFPQPLSFSPAVSGSGEWLNTSIYLFRPDQPLAGSTSYTVTVAAGLSDQTGGVMPEPYSWSFTTLTPAVTGVIPAFREADVALTGPITVTFNQPMDRASTEAAFQLAGNPGGAVPGAFTWNDDSSEFSFAAARRLDYGTSYQISVGTSARSAGGAAPLGDAYSSVFRTVRYPAIVSTTPSDGDRSANPYGGFRLQFTAPMDERTLQSQVAILPAPTRVYTYFSSYDFSFNIRFSLQPSTPYTVTIGPDMRDPYGTPTGDSREIHFTTGPLEAQAWMNTTGGVGTYNAADEAALFMTSINVDSVHYALYGLTLSQFVQATGPESYKFRHSGTPLRSWDQPIQNQLNETILTKVSITGEEGGRLPPGLYMLELIAPTPNHSDQRQAMVVSSANVTLKTGLREALVWATDINSGQPLVGEPVTLFNGKQEVIAAGQTGPDGVFRAEIPRLDDLWTTVFAVLGRDPASPNFAVAANQWSEGINPWDFWLDSAFYVQDVQAYLYTDRPVYRPGQIVYFRGVVRAEDDARYFLPDIISLPVEIYNDRGERIFSDTLKLNEYGAFTSQLTLADEAGVGYYSIQTPYGGIGFQVAEYRKPEFQVSVTTAQAQVVRGSSIPVTVEASYFFGSPVADAAVNYSVLTAPYYFQYEGPGYYDWSDYDFTSGMRPPTYGSYGELLSTGETHTDARGRATFSIPADPGKATTSQTFTIEATVTETAGGQQVSGRVAVTVHQGDFYLGVRPADYIGVAGQPTTAELLAVGWDQAPRPNQPATVQFSKHEWFSVQELDEYGNKVYTWNAKDTPVAEVQVTTGADGAASASFTPTEGGTYKILVTGLDSGGRTVRASTYVWITSGDYVNWRVENDDRIILISDRRDYQPGDSAEILIPSPFQGSATALVTVERGRILQHEVITLSNNSTVYRLPITEAFAPDVFVSVVLVKGVDENNPAPGFKVGMVKLAVNNASRQINITLTPDRAKVGPRDTVRYTLKATDHRGQPVRAEFSLALADLAALSLADPNSAPILDYFYGQRGLGVRTGMGLVLNVNRLTEAAARAKGGGGGGGEGSFFEVRSQFLDTAFWRADVVTDASGQASVEITLPDNLTTWRLDARGVTPDTLVGQSTVDIVATRDLLIRPVTPRFFVVGDHARIGAIVNNNTGGDIQAEVTLEASGLTLQDPATQSVTVLAGGRAQVNWTVGVQDVEAVDATFSVSGGGLTDASKPPLGLPPDRLLPVYRYSTPETVGTAGQLESAASVVEGISLPRRFDVTQGELSVELNPSLAASLTEGLTYLRNSPYDSTENTVSRFLPNVLTLRALDQLGIPNPELHNTLVALVDRGLQKLYNQQHADGGWGWYPTSPSDPYISAYVIFGLAKAEQSGFPVSRDVMMAGSAYLIGTLRAPEALAQNWRMNRQMFVLYALAEAGRGDQSRTAAMYVARQRLSRAAQGYLALTLASFDAGDARLATLLSDLNNSAVLSATGAHWEEDNPDWWNMGTDIRTTAVALDVLARLDPENALAPNVVRWLMSSREATGAWRSTQETAWSLISLTDWMVHTGELEANYDYRLSLNGQQLTAGHAGQENLLQPVTLKVAVADLLRDQANRLLVERGPGEGRLYYKAHLRVFQDVTEVTALSRGIVVSRRYTIPSKDCGGSGQPICPAISQAIAGQDIRVTLTIVAPNDLYYAVIEDPLPAGAEAVDTSLKTTSVVGQAPELNYMDPLYYGWGWWWFSNTDIRDEKLVLSAAFLPEGTYEYTYVIHASLPGIYKVLPPTARQQYFPEVQGRGDGMEFIIAPGE